MTRAQADTLAAWLADTAAGIAYGTVRAEIIVHDGQVREIRRSTEERDRSFTDVEEDNSQGQKGRRFGAT